jgi:AraC-like DNA-binding protein
VSTNPVPTFRAAHLGPYLDYFLNRDIAIEGALREFKLPFTLGTEQEARLPLWPALEFLAHIQRINGVQDLAFLVNNHLNIDLFHATNRRGIQSAQTLDAAINGLAIDAVQECSILEILTCREGAATRLVARLHTSDDDRELRALEFHFIMLLYAVIKGFADVRWAPVTMGFRCREPLSPLVGHFFPRTRFLFGQQESSISVPQELFDRERYTHASRVSAREPINEHSAFSPDDLVTSLKHILPTYLADGYLNIDLVADICRVSVRTLQRSLAQSNVTYSKLIELARLELAQELLGDHGIKIIDVAYAVGYDDPSHFSRAFRRAAGISPRAFRNGGEPLEERRLPQHDNA